MSLRKSVGTSQRLLTHLETDQSPEVQNFGSYNSEHLRSESRPSSFHIVANRKRSTMSSHPKSLRSEMTPNETHSYNLSVIGTCADLRAELK